jgi:hypothetical protein
MIIIMKRPRRMETDGGSAGRDFFAIQSCFIRFGLRSDRLWPSLRCRESRRELPYLIFLHSPFGKQREGGKLELKVERWEPSSERRLRKRMNERT